MPNGLVMIECVSTGNGLYEFAMSGKEDLMGFGPKGFDFIDPPSSAEFEVPSRNAVILHSS